MRFAATMQQLYRATIVFGLSAFTFVSNYSIMSASAERSSITVNSTTPPTSAKKRQKWDDELPSELVHLTAKDLGTLVCIEERCKKRYLDFDFKEGVCYKKATGVRLVNTANSTAGDDEEGAAVIDISNLNVAKIRKLACNMGVRQSSRMAKDVILFTLARLSSIGEVIDMQKVSSTPVDDKKRYNTLVRLINTIFSEAFITDLLAWNDARNRKEHELGVGGKMQRFFVDVAEVMYAAGKEKNSGQDSGDDSSSISSSSTTNDESNCLGKIDNFADDEDGDPEKIAMYIEIAELDPTDFYVFPPKQLLEWTQLLIKARKQLRENMNLSGTHSNDQYDFVDHALKKTKLTKKLGRFPLYYFCMKSKGAPDFDAKFQSSMNEALKGDSTTDIDGISMITAGTEKASKTTINQDQSMERIADSFEKIQQASERSAVASERNAKWDELDKLEKKLRDVGSPLPERLRTRIEKRIENLYEELCPE
jgi:hypothetical protein